MRSRGAHSLSEHSAKAGGPALARDREAQAAIRREQVLSAALALFCEHGYTATSTRRIAEAAGVAEGLVFHYFPTKDALLWTLAARQHSFAGRVLTVMLQAGDSPARDLLGAVADGLAGVSAEEGAFIGFMLAEAQVNAELRARVTAATAAVLDGFVRTLADRVATGELRADAALDVAAHGFFGGFLFFFTQHRHLGAAAWQREAAAFARAWADQCWRGIAARRSIERALDQSKKKDEPRPMTDVRPAAHPTTLARAFALTAHQARAAFAAVRAVAEADGPARASGAALLRVAAETLEQHDPDAIAAASADELADAFPSLVARRTLVDILVIPACIDGEVTVAGEALVRSFARSLGVRSHWVDTLGALRRRKVLAVKLQLARRSPDARRLFARTWAEDGLRGVWRALLFVLGRYTDPALAARFRALAQLPEGTLGRKLFTDLTARGLAFPGERGGLPERMLHHDLMHVANDYSTDPAGECEIAGFYAGFCPGDPFTFIVIVLATFHLGLPVSPAIITPARGAFDPARVVAAFLRGRRLRVDVMGPWDYWALMPLPLAEVRGQLGIADPA